MGERGVAVDHTTLYRWVQRYAPELEKRTPWYRNRLSGTRCKNPVASREGLIASVAHAQRPNRRLMKRASVTYLSQKRSFLRQLTTEPIPLQSSLLRKR